MKTQQHHKQDKFHNTIINSEYTDNALPEKNTTRWVAKRKAQVIEAVRSGVITLDQACERYSLSVEEFVSWQRHFDQQGIRGLCVTKLKR
ncbi:MAG: DUF1153 domain-containing protein [Sphingomonadales bacterium]|nr:DUF1153 domain-containing protein [Sphingomonadales bacterium]